MIPHAIFLALICSPAATIAQHPAEIEAALQRVPDDQRPGMEWLVEHMPEPDRRALKAEFLLENCDLAYRAWREVPWKDRIDEALFFDAILPYACVNERRDRWRPDFRERFSPLVAEAKTPGEAAAILNNEIFGLVGVKYSTKRKKPDQSPLESMESGLASCTGLSILLVDACRAVGVPARLAGTPLWSDGSGNHTWVEVWDDGWHFTGAAEPSGMELDRAWFTGRAAGAKVDDPRLAIYAVTWRKTPIHFPMVWRRKDTTYRAVNVTSRYMKAKPVEEGYARVRFRVVEEETGERLEALILVVRGGAGILFSGFSRDESFDANDHLTARLRLGAEHGVSANFGNSNASATFTVERDEQLVTLTLSAQGESPRSTLSSAISIGGLRAHLAEESLETVPDQLFASTPLTADDTAEAMNLVREHHGVRIRAERLAELEARVIELDGMEMPFWYKTFGEAPEGGRSLVFSMHGGGGAPARVNDRQYENQKRLYELEEGIYLVPRAPTNTWNLWHQAHIDRFFDRLIEDLVALEHVNPDRVYITGYSAGGDGVFQLAPRFADRLAAAAMMAGHPNETQPDGLRNIGFALHVGGKDSAYSRNEIGRQWKEKLAELREADPEGYAHQVEVHEDKGHWMDREDAVALPWMAKFTRDLRPDKVVWLQDDVTHPRFYWLAVDEPKARQRVVVEREGQEIRILEAEGPMTLRIRLDDSMIDLDREVRVVRGQDELFRGVIPRTIAVIARTLSERGDPKGIFSGEVVVTLPGPESED